MWMQAQIQEADFVLLVCTETYLRRVERRDEPGKGRGVLWEATLIYNLLYAEEPLYRDLFRSCLPMASPPGFRFLCAG